jgi:hypothetical protein
MGVEVVTLAEKPVERTSEFIATLKRKNVSVISTLAREEAMFVYGEAGMSPAELRLWIYDLPKLDWSPDALACFAWRHGFGRPVDD